MADREGLYITVAKSGLITFRFDYQINGRRETLTIGKYPIVSLASAREKLLDAKKLLAQGISPATEKQRQKQQAKSTYFGDWLTRWFDDANYKDSTRRMIQGVIKRDIAPKFGKKLLSEITPDILRNHCDKVKSRGAGRPHMVYLSRQALDLFMQLHILAAGSPFVLPSFGQSQHGTIALSSLNRAANHAIQLAQKQELPPGDFTIHDMPPLAG